MRKIFTLAFALLGFGFASAQNTELSLTIRYNLSDGRYEVFAKPGVSNDFNLGPTQVSLVLPSGIADIDIDDPTYQLTSINGGIWGDNSQVYAPGNTPESDYHGFGSNGAPISLVAGQELMLFHFKLPGDCIAGLRVFENGVDPESNAHIDMGGSDFRNSFADAGFNDHYSSVYENTGSTCAVCAVSAPTLSIN